MLTNVIEKSLLLYDEIYREHGLENPERLKLGIRLNTATGAKYFGRKKIDDDVFDYLANEKKLLEVNITMNYKNNGDYHVFYTLRPEVKKLAKTAIPEHNGKPLRGIKYVVAIPPEIHQQIHDDDRNSEFNVGVRKQKMENEKQKI